MTAWLLWSIVGVILVAIALTLRIAVHMGQRPGGVDTWYFLAYAEAIRSQRRVDAELPQYLLQDRRQSYPPLFPLFLSLLPKAWLDRWFWLVSPALDCVHLLLLYWLSYRITLSIAVACITAAIYACTPQLVAETRSLTARSFSALIHSLAVLSMLKALFLGPFWPWAGVAVGAGAAMFLTSATASASYAVTALILAVLRGDPRYVFVPPLGLALAFVVSGGHFRKVVGNYWSAVRFWTRHRTRLGAHPVHHSPVYGDPSAAVALRPGFLGSSRPRQVLRMFGENPFLLALAAAPVGTPPWGLALFWWATGLSVLAVFATIVPGLRFLGPGRSYLLLAAFPIAYTIGVGLGGPARLTSPFGLVVLAGLAAATLAIAFFLVYTRNRPSERTDAIPEGLRHAAAALGAAPPGGFLCLPYVYADYASYASGKPTLWGFHCGDLRRIECVLPVIGEPLPTLLAAHGARYLLLDAAYVSLSEIDRGLRSRPLGRWDTFELHEVLP